RPRSAYARDDEALTLNVAVRPTRQQRDVHTSLRQVSKQIDRPIAKNLQPNAWISLVELYGYLGNPFEITSTWHAYSQVPGAGTIFIFQSGQHLVAQPKDARRVLVKHFPCRCLTPGSTM